MMSKTDSNLLHNRMVKEWFFAEDIINYHGYLGINYRVDFYCPFECSFNNGFHLN